MTLTLEQLRALASLVGFPPASIDTAAAIAMAESRGDPAAIGDSGTSVGLWQIHLPDHPEVSSWPLTDPTTNARAALLISRQGTYFHPWSTYAIAPYPYLQYMPASASSSTTRNVLAVAAGAGLAAVVDRLLTPRGRLALRRVLGL